MSVKIKLLKNELIRRFGKPVLEVQENIAKKYVDLKQAIIIEDEKKEEIKKETVKKDKLEEMIQKNEVIYPDIDDPLFPQIK